MGQLGDLSPLGSIAVGVIVGLLSTSVQSLGLTLQRKSHILEDEKGLYDVRRPPHRRRRWQLGMLMFVVSNLFGSTIQITTLPLPVLSTLQASGLVFNSICASLILGEPFTRWSFGGTLLVCAGAVLIAIFGAIGEPAHNLDQLLALLERRQFILWMIGQAVIVVFVIGGARALKLLRPRTSHNPGTRLSRGMAFGFISGILSAHSLLVAKTAVELLVRTVVDRVNQFNRWQSWMVLLGLIALALSQLYYLHRGLELCSTSILYPFVFCVYNVVAILDGLIYFKQTSRLSFLHALLIAIGTGVLLCGVLALSWRLQNDPTNTPPVAQSALGPGMGLVDPENNENYNNKNDQSSQDSHMVDEESTPVSDEQQSLLHDGNGDVRIDKGDPHVRRSETQCVAEAEEIWGELEDDAAVFLPPSRHHRAYTTNASGKAYWDEDINGDETTALLRAKTGRSHISRRRMSAPIPPLAVPRMPSRSVASASRSQEALMGRWTWHWWRRPPKGEESAQPEGTSRSESGDQ